MAFSSPRTSKKTLILDIKESLSPDSKLVDLAEAEVFISSADLKGWGFLFEGVVYLVRCGSTISLFVRDVKVTEKMWIFKMKKDVLVTLMGSFGTVYLENFYFGFRYNNDEEALSFHVSLKNSINQSNRCNSFSEQEENDEPRENSAFIQLKNSATTDGECTKLSDCHQMLTKKEELNNNAKLNHDSCVNKACANEMSAPSPAENVIFTNMDEVETSRCADDSFQETSTSPVGSSDFLQDIKMGWKHLKKVPEKEKVKTNASPLSKALYSRLIALRLSTDSSNSESSGDDDDWTE